MAQQGKERKRRPWLGFVGLLCLVLGLVAVFMRSPNWNPADLQNADPFIRLTMTFCCLWTPGVLIVVGIALLIYTLWTGQIKLFG